MTITNPLSSFIRAANAAQSLHHALIAATPLRVNVRERVFKIPFQSRFFPMSEHGRHIRAIEKIENQESWVQFRRQIEVLSQEERGRIQAVVHGRYGEDFQRNEREGRPLLAKHVEMVGVALRESKTRDLKSCSQERLSSLSLEELYPRIQELKEHSYIGRPIEGYDWNPVFFADYFLMDKERMHLLSEENIERISHLPNALHAYLEMWTKQLVRLEPEEKTVIAAPKPGGGIDYYKIYKKITSDKGLIAYGLVPIFPTSALPPLLVFRPTQSWISAEDSLETMFNDLELKMGERGYRAAREMLGNLMRDPHFRRGNQRVTCAGFSIGGVHLQRFLVDHWESVSEAVFFNDPSVDIKTANRFARIVNARERMPNPIAFTIYRTSKDFPHYVGGRHIGSDVTHPDVNVKIVKVIPRSSVQFAGGLERHIWAPLAAENTPYTTEVFVGELAKRKLDNMQRGPKVFLYELMRIFIGYLLMRPLIFFIYFPLRFLCKKLNIPILRFSQEVRARSHT